jgi:hypothetical protein
MNTSIAVADTSAGRGSLVLVGTLLVRSFGLAAGVALALLVVAFLAAMI